MAQYTAIVEASQALLGLLRDCLTPEPIEKSDHIALLSPFDSEDAMLTVQLFHVEEDPQNNMHGFYQQGNTLQKRYSTVCMLYFLITAHSKAPASMRDADCQRIIGRVIQAIKDNSVLGSKYLSGSILSSNCVLKPILQKPSYEQILKIWNNTAVPYKLSVVCQLSGIEIDSNITRRVGRVAEVEIGTDQKGL